MFRSRSRPARWCWKISPKAASTKRALFHLLNLAREERAYVLITARSAAGDVADRGAPISPRGCARLPVVALTAPDDALFRAVLVKLFADRQLAVDESLVAFLTTRIERSFAAARAAVARLDREALRLQRPVTRALAGELFRRALTAPPSGGHVILASSMAAIMAVIYLSWTSWPIARKRLF